MDRRISLESQRLTVVERLIMRAAGATLSFIAFMTLLWVAGGFQ